MNIYKKIISLIIIVILLVVFLTGCKISFNVGFSNKTIATQTMQEDDDTLQFDINEIEIALDVFIKKLNSLEDETELNKELAMFKNNSNLIESCIYFANETGQFYVYPTIELPEDYDARTRVWYKGAINGEIYVSEPYVAADTGEEVITIAKKVTIDDEIIGVVGLDVTIRNN